MRIAPLSGVSRPAPGRMFDSERRLEGIVVHLASSRSSLVRLTPVADALAAIGVRQVMFDPTAPADDSWRVTSGRPPLTRDYMTAEHTREQGAEQLMATVEDALDRLRPAMLMVAGDSDAAVTGALVASKMGIPVARVGAGLRCDDWGLREEVARVVLDTVATRFYVDGPEATMTLASQGIAEERIEEVGSTLADSVIRWRRRAAVRAAWTDFKLAPRKYVLATLHREENLATDEQLARITNGLSNLARRIPLLLVLHPRTRAALEPTGDLETLHAAGVLVADPLDYIDFLSLELAAGALLTDSAGAQEEATILGVPCFTLRRTTERTLTLTHGTNVLLGDDPAEIADIALREHREPAPSIPRWDGQAGKRIAADLHRATAEVLQV